jgi:hypothetical protein
MPLNVGADGGLAATERLGERDDVGHHAVVLESEEAAGATDATLHLVGEPDHAVLVAQRAHALPVALGREHDAGPALYRLDDEGADRGVGLEGLLERVEVAEAHPAPVGQQREAALVELGIGH